MIRSRTVSFAVTLVGCVITSSPAFANCTVPNLLTNGQVADASAVMDNFDAVAACADEAVKPSGTSPAGSIVVFSGARAVTNGNLTGDVTTSGGTATTLSATGVSAGTYNNAVVTVDAKGRVLAASNGSPGGGGLELLEVHPPTTSLFSLSNIASGASLSIVGGNKIYSVRRTDTGAASVDKVAFQGKAVPAGLSWSAVMGFWTNPWATSGYYRTGLTILESSTGKNITLYYNLQAGVPRFEILYLSSLNTFSSAPFVSGNMPAGRIPLMQKIEYDGVNYKFYYSFNFGQEWILAVTIAKASYFTADRIGIGMETYNNISANNFVTDIWYYRDPDFL